MWENQTFLCVFQKDLIILDDIHRVFAVDALASSHPLSSEEDSITLPHQISEQFDVISYSKVRGLLPANTKLSEVTVVSVPDVSYRCWFVSSWYNKVIFKKPRKNSTQTVLCQRRDTEGAMERMERTVKRQEEIKSSRTDCQTHGLKWHQSPSWSRSLFTIDIKTSKYLTKCYSKMFRCLIIMNRVL